MKHLSWITLAAVLISATALIAGCDSGAGDADAAAHQEELHGDVHGNEVNATAESDEDRSVVSTDLPAGDLYDENADTRALIAKAVKYAKEDEKRVLIVWGGNWCGWCHKLHSVFENNEAINQVLQDSFVRVAIDSRSNKALMKEMNVKPRGVPYLTVLDGDGEKIADQATGPLEVGGAHDPAKVLAFLNKVKP